MKNYDKLKKIIQEANPEIMEPIFGCDTQYGVITKVKNQQLFLMGSTGYITKLQVKRGKVKILGRPIRIADVLLAIECNREPNEFKLDIDSKGYMTLCNFKWEKEKQVEWDFKKNLDNQSDETKQFLIYLLVK